MAVAVATQRGEEAFRRGVDGLGRLVLQPLQIGGHLAAQRLDHAAGGDVPDPLQPLQVTGRREPGHLVAVAASQRDDRAAERAHPVGRLVRALQEERDAAQVGDRVA